MEMCHNKERPSSTTTTGNGGLRIKYCESFALLALFLLHFYSHYGHCSSSFPLFLLSPPSPLGCSGITSSGVTHWHYILMAGRAVIVLAYIP